MVIHSGRKLFELADKGVADAIAVMPQGRLFAANFRSGKVSELTLYLDDVLALARDRVTRQMTEAERLQYLRTADDEGLVGDR